MIDLLAKVIVEWEKLYEEVSSVDRMRCILPLLRKVWDDKKEREKLLDMWWKEYESIKSARERFYALTRLRRFLHEKIKGEVKENTYELPEI